MNQLSSKRRLASALTLGVSAAVALTTIAGCSTNSSSAQSSSAKSGPTQVNVVMKNDGSGDVCSFDTTSVPAGPVTFSIKNESASGIIEFELLQQQRIVGEKENLAPGLAPVSFTTTLTGGAYKLYCPGAKQEMTDFTVTGQAAPSATGSVATLLNQGADEYKTYVKARLSDLLDGVKTMQNSIDSGNLEQAKKDYAATRQFYEKVESDVSGFLKPGTSPDDNSGNLDYLIDMRESNLDPAVGWHGFHAIERDLWQGGKITDGTKKLTAELVTNVTTLNDVAKDLSFKPEDLANGAAGLLEEVQANKVSGEEEKYSHIDLVDLASNVEGARQAFALLEPGLTKIDPTLSKQIQDQFTKVDQVMSKYRDASSLGGYKTYDDATKAEASTKISQAVQALQEPMSKLAAKVANAG